MDEIRKAYLSVVSLRNFLLCSLVWGASPLTALEKDRSTPVQLTYLWHMHQPIYWPARIPGGQRVQWAAESFDLKTKGFNRYLGSPYPHPRNNLAQGDFGQYDPIFSKDDRVQAYQWRLRDSLRELFSHPNGGAQISYTGSLMDNIQSFGQKFQLGYSPRWWEPLKEAFAWKTSASFSRGNLIGINYHHSLGPLLSQAVLRKELQLFKSAWCETWGPSPCSSGKANGLGPAGYFPPEVAFSRRMIPLLKEEGFEWTFVAAIHLARSTKNFLSQDVAPLPGIGTWNTNPPNRADALNPDVDPSQWWSGSIDGRGAKLPAPFAYYPHRAAYVDPETGEVSEIVVVPMDDVLGYMDGFGPINLNLVQDNIAPFALSLRGPPLVVLGHDGDNAWGGGYSYYMESVPNTSRQAHSLGYSMTTVDQYLADFPVPKGDRVHVEDGGWVNPESDWGDPQFVKWLYPPARSSRHPEFNQHDPRTYIDIEEGFSTTWRSWAVIVAGANLCESLEQMFKGRPLDISQIRAPRSDSTAVERCWHFYLSGLDSGFMYYGDSLDDEVKQSLGLSEAYREVKSSLDLKKDKTPPSLLPPQRWPYNPGGKAWGVTTRYKAVGFNGKPPNERDFYVWTLAFDLSGMDRVYLHWRTSEKSEYSLSNLDQETYQGGPGLSSWQTLPMNSRNIDPMFRGDPPSPQLDYFIQPPLIAHHYWVKIQGLKRVMVDYYIEAFDKMGNRVRSGIEHVWVD